MIIFLGLVSGIIVGFGVAQAWRDVSGQLMQDKHNETVILQGKEIARLRAQVASLIGKT